MQLCPVVVTNTCYEFEQDHKSVRQKESPIESRCTIKTLKCSQMLNTEQYQYVHVNHLPTNIHIFNAQITFPVNSLHTLPFSPNYSLISFHSCTALRFQQHAARSVG